MMRAGAFAVFLAGFSVLLPLGLSADAETPPGFAVVELFTSEGCSSCPPADEALSRLVREAEQQKRPIYALEWHVDYWDYLGWKDPWGSRLATQRQYAYARTLPSSVYTPQVVINGSLVPDYAGDLKELENDARRAAAQPSGSSLSVTAIQVSSTAIKVAVRVSHAPVGAEMLVAEVEGDLTATPNAGENAGRALVHSSVVRAAKVIRPLNGEVLLDIPPAARGTTRTIITLLQDSSTLRILAAARTEIASEQALSGRIIDAAGKPVRNVLVRACSDKLCVPGMTTDDGYFVLDGLLPGRYEVDVDYSLPASVTFLQKPEGVVVIPRAAAGKAAFDRS